MSKDERDKLCKAVAEALSLSTEGIMAHFSHVQVDKKEQATLFAFTQMRMFEMDIDDNAVLTLTPRNRIEDLISQTAFAPKKSVLPPPGKFELMDPNCWKKIGEYVRSIPFTE